MNAGLKRADSLYSPAAVRGVSYLAVYNKILEGGLQMESPRRTTVLCDHFVFLIRWMKRSLRHKRRVKTSLPISILVRVSLSLSTSVFHQLLPLPMSAQNASSCTPQTHKPDYIYTYTSGWLHLHAYLRTNDLLNENVSVPPTKCTLVDEAGD